ncbi:MAG TPA: PaaI family thioesterase [Pyrinomonadaceae bacterium]|nr:PaaI family thioesterase [Pyrinomonadaceae bacterium]
MINKDSERTLTIRWEDPRVFAEAGHGLSGLEFLQKVVAGELPRPPMADLMNFDLVEVGDGFAIFTAVPAEYHYNPIGVVHGGLAATLLDSAMGCAIHSTLPPETAYTTLEVKVNFVRALTTQTGRVRCEARVIHVGTRTATAEARLVDAADKLYAHGTTTCMVIREPQRNTKSTSDK